MIQQPQNELNAFPPASPTLFTPLLWTGYTYDREKLGKYAGQTVGILGMLAGLALFFAAAIKMGQEGESSWLFVGAMGAGMAVSAGASRLARHGRTSPKESLEGAATGAFLGLYYAGWEAFGLDHSGAGLIGWSMLTICTGVFLMVATIRAFGGSPGSEHGVEEPGANTANRASAQP